MADKESLPTIVGVFRHQAAAAAAVHRLTEADFGADEIGLLAPGQADPGQP